jgi:hypothetical protein
MAESVVYTCLFGGYEDLLEQPQARNSRMDFLCFTDDPHLVSESWRVVHTPGHVRGDAQRSSRHPKINPHLYLSEYRTSLYIDNTVLLRRRPESVIREMFPDRPAMGVFEHSFRDSLEDEFVAVLRNNRDSPERVHLQRERYRLNHPDLLAKRPIIGGVLLRNHMEATVIRAMKRWWREVMTSSSRDQLSLLVALDESDLLPTVARLDIKDNDYWKWPVWTGRGRRTSDP